MQPKEMEWPLEWKVLTHSLVLNCLIYCSLHQSNCQSICKPRISQFRRLCMGQNYWCPGHLKSLRTDAKYNAFYEEVIHTSQGLTSEPTIPRQRKLPKRLDDGASPHAYLTLKDRFRHKYFETLELAVGETERRFNQEDIGVINSLESFLIDSANGNSASMPDNLETYLKDIGFDSKYRCQCSPVWSRPALRPLNKWLLWEQLLGPWQKVIYTKECCRKSTNCWSSIWCFP